MAKTTAPLLSFDGSGQIAKTMVYAKWRGRPYVRRHVIPANPKTAEQTKTRILFAWLNAIWKAAPASFLAPWDLFASGQPLLGRNAMVGKNVKILRGLTVITAMNFSPGAKGGLAPTSISAAAGAGQSVVTVVPSTPPTGWSITASQGVALLQQDPQTQIITAMDFAEDTAAPFDTITLAALPAGNYVVSVWLKFLKPDGTVAYGPAINDTVTTT